MALLTLNPILDFKPRDTIEFTLVICHENQVPGFSLSCQQQIHRANRPSFGFQRTANRAVIHCCQLIKIQNGERYQKLKQSNPVAIGRIASGYTIFELRNRDCGYGDIIWLPGSKTLYYRSRFPVDYVDADIGVEKEPHPIARRLSGSPCSLGKSKKSSENLLRLLTKDCQGSVPLGIRITTPSILRTKTSSPGSEYFLGSRTA